MTITGAGDCGIDHYIDQSLSRPGGITLNFCVHARSLLDPDDTVTAVTCLGNDPEAQIVLEALQSHGIATSIKKVPGKTPIQEIGVGPDGEKIFIKYEAGVLEGATLSAKQQQTLRSSDVVITPLFTQVESFFEDTIACKPKQLLAADFMDLSDYKKSVDSIIKYLKIVDVGFFGLSTQDKDLIADLQRISEKLRKIFVITLGADGSQAFVNGKPYSAPPIRVDKVIDTTGAGDAFAAMFLKQYLTTGSVETSLRAGNEYAGEVVQKVGGF